MRPKPARHLTPGLAAAEHATFSRARVLQVLQEAPVTATPPETPLTAVVAPETPLAAVAPAVMAAAPPVVHTHFDVRMHVRTCPCRCVTGA